MNQNNRIYDHVVFWLPVALVALCYLSAKISTVAPLFILALALTPIMRRTPFHHRWLWESLSLFFFLFLFVDIMLISRHVGVATTHLLCFLLVSRMWSRPDARILGQRMILAFVFWILIGAINNDVFYLYDSLLIVPSLITMMLAYHARMYEMQRPPQWRLVRWAIGVTLAIMPLSFVLFIIMPRYHLGYAIPGPIPFSESTSGLGDSVNLSDITRIKADPSPAFTVDWIRPAEAPPPNILYWRALIFDTFDGHTWTRTLPHKITYIQNGSRGYGIYTGYRTPPGGQPFIYRIEPLTLFPAIIHVGTPIMVRFYGSRIAISDAFELFHDNHRPYGIISHLDPAPPAHYRIPPLFDHEGSSPAYRSVSRDLYRLKRFADAWIPADLPVPKAAARLESYLRQNYTYTTEIYNIGERFPLVGFLEHRFSGHCEFFASSMAILLRLKGIPTRLVTGYRGGEIVGLSSTMVRQAMAHSWVEVWDETSRSWLGFDPTPARPVSPAWWRRPLEGLRKISSKIEGWWDEQIVLYSSQTQLAYIRALRDRFRFYRGHISGWITTLKDWMKSPRVHLRVEWLSFILFFLLIPTSFYLFIQYRRHKKAARTHPLAKTIWTLMKTLEKRYGPRWPSETWKEYLNRITRDTPGLKKEWQRIIRAYYELRYNDRPDPGAVRAFTERVAAFRRNL